MFQGAVYPPGVPLAGATNTWYYNFDSYDTGPQINASGIKTGVTEIHYALDWTGTIGPREIRPISSNTRSRLPIRQ